MAITVVRSAPSLAGRRMENDARLNLDNSYPTGGYVIPGGLGRLGVRDADLVIAGPKGAYSFEWDYTARKLKVITAGAEVTAATDLSAIRDVRLYVRGRP